MLKTDLSSFEVRRGEVGDTVHFALASYWTDCPLPYNGADGSPFALGSQTLTTHILSVQSIRPWETGVHYRLPLAACEALCVDAPMSLIPFRIELEHVPYAGSRADDRVYSTGLWFGSHTLCGLFTAETAKRWASVPPDTWRAVPLDALCRPYGLDASWLDSLRPGVVRISRADSLLPRSIEVYRETA